MLYDRWLEVARVRRDEFALREVASGRAWTFGQLARDAETAPSPDGPCVHPCDLGANFIFDVLRGWRAGRVVCPLEAGQTTPVLPSLPAGCAHLKFTSATTGEPRLVAFTAAQLAQDAANIVATMGLRPDWSNLGVISLAHSYGFSNLVTPLLLHGIPLVLAPSPLPETVRLAAEGADSLILPAVPALWRAWHEAGTIPPNVRLSISAGAPLPLPLEEAIFAVSGLKVHNFYGATECGGIAYDRTNSPRTDAAIIGAAMEGVTLAVGSDGCLIVRGQAVGETYLPEPDPALGSGQFVTRDLVEIIEGVVHFRGRAGDHINVAGRKVAPASIEAALGAHPGVRDCVVLSVPAADVGRGEEIAVVAAVRAGTGATDLKQFLQARLPAWQVPRIWRLVEALPVNARGKLSRARLREELMGTRTDQSDV